MTQGAARRQGVILFLGAAFGALIGIALARLSDGALRPPVPGAAGLLLALVLYLVCIAAHETGHLAAGALAGFRPLLLIAGPQTPPRATMLANSC